jgi:hypothetical protein
MKTLKSIALGLTLFIATAAAKANTLPGDNGLTRNYTITTYVNAISHGKIDDLKAVIDNDANFSMQNGKELTSYDKSEMLEFLASTKGVEQQCVVTTTNLEGNNDQAVVRVDLNYNTFTRSNYVTITNTSAGWKITNVYSVFKDKK